MEKYELSDNPCFYRRCHPETCCCGNDELLVIENIFNEHGVFKYTKIIQPVYSRESGEKIISSLKNKDELEEKVRLLNWETEIKKYYRDINKNEGGKEKKI